MYSHICPESKFFGDVATHEMIVVRDDGVNRHIRFKRPGTRVMHFDLITWEGHLCYSGDMGTYVFKRLEDMFEFFRGEGFQQNPEATLLINPGYWSEKVTSTCPSGVTEFSEERFCEVVSTTRLEWVRDRSMSRDERRRLWDAVKYQVLDAVQDGEECAKQAAYNFSFESAAGVFDFADIWEYAFDLYTYRFIWCCYAIAWGIARYDQQKAEAIHA